MQIETRLQQCGQNPEPARSPFGYSVGKLLHYIVSRDGLNERMKSVGMSDF